MMRTYKRHQQSSNGNVGSVVFQDTQEEPAKKQRYQLYMLIYLPIAIPVYCHLAAYHAISGLELRVNFYHYKHPAALLGWRP